MTTNGKHKGMTTHPVVTAYLQHLSDIGRPDSTISTYESALRRAAAELPGGLLSYDYEIEAWLGGRGAPSTRVVYRAALRGFYAWAVKRGRISENPAGELEPVPRQRHLPRPVPVEQVRQLLATVADPVRLWAHLAAYAGARCCEVARLRREDISQQSTYVHGKGGRERVIPTHPELWAMVRHLPSGLLAGGLNRKQISSRAAVAFDQADLPDVTMHRLRHTAGTMWQAATGDIRVTQELLGHASITTTQVYTAVSDQAMRAAVLAMPALTAAATAAGAAPVPAVHEPPPPR